MSWVRCPSAAPIIKNPRQRGACPQKQRRIGREGYQLTAGPSNTRRYCSAAYQPKTSQSEPVVGPGPEVYSAPQIPRRQGYVVTHRHERPILAVLQNFCRAAWTIRAYYRTATGQSLGDHITKSLPGRRENKDRSTRHVSEGILHESWQCYIIRDAELASKRQQWSLDWLPFARLVCRRGSSSASHARHAPEQTLVPGWGSLFVV